ncbi:MAG TPA: hypothetical protein VHL34_07160 [Rhizomicrobium sp.]|nr:hypothetical protein [Rhizomicrobium sp.]
MSVAHQKRRVTVHDPVEGDVSPNDVRAYLLATGWTLKHGLFEQVAGDTTRHIRCPLDDETAREIAVLICDIASITQRTPGEVLRSVEALARAEGRCP